jgi:exosortase A
LDQTVDVTADPGTGPGVGDAATRWPAALGALAAGLVGLIALFWPAAAKAVEVWSTTSAYNHLFLIAPISLYVIWERRRTVARLAPAPALAAVLALPIFALAWLAGALLEIYEVQQFALIAMMDVLIVAVLGWRVCRALAFPLLYLWLLVPTGEFLLAGLQHLTTAAATWGLEQAGLPVYTEGILIETPSGRYRVEPGCAGLNFLLAALAFALLFANLIYRGWLKRGLAVVLALAIAIVANWLRVWGIILIDHLTGNRTDIVDDHLVYGWAFFAAVMAAAMVLGLRWRDDGRPAPDPGTGQLGTSDPGPGQLGTSDPGTGQPGRTGARTRPAGFAGAAGLVVALAALAPAYVYFAAPPSCPRAITGAIPGAITEGGSCAD